MAQALSAPLTRAKNGGLRWNITLPVAAIALILFALAARALPMGDPVVQIDEQFYLLVGGRVLHGALPYVDIWDRKPIGLFLLFAGFRALGGSGVLTYQLAALISVWGTALILFVLARRIAPAMGALAAAILYVAWLNLAGGEAGQSPVFYNLPVAAAIALIFFARDRLSAGAGDLRLTGIAAMLLFGIAMQIKYSCVFEGVFAGLMLIGLSWKAGRSLLLLAGDMLLWVGCALLPAAIAAFYYWRIGHLPEWWFANATSILSRGSEAPATIAERLELMIALVLPLVLCIPLRRWLGYAPADDTARQDLRFLDGWAASALLGVVLFGTWFNHYALPLFAPLAVTVAPLWCRSVGRAWLSLMIFVGVVVGERAVLHHQVTRGDGRILAAAAAATRGMRGCPFVYDGYPALYDVTNSCLPTTRPFSAHLQSKNEIGATGIDEASEVRRIMALRPDRVMTMEPAYDEENLASRAELYHVLSRGYRELFLYTSGGHQLVVYGREGSIPADLAPIVIRKD